MWHAIISSKVVFEYRIGKPKVALQYLNTVLDLEKSLNNSDISIARTHLNICAIESLLGRHRVALENAQKAIKIAMNVKDTEKQSEQESSQTTLIIAFYNTAIEFEHLHKYRQAHFACTYGLNFCKEILGDTHPLYNKLNDFLISIEKHKRIQEKQEKAIRLMQVRPNIKRIEKSELISSPYESEEIRLPKRAVSCIRRKKFSPRNTRTLTKQFVLPSIKIPSDKYYDYTTSKLKDKEDFTFTQEEALKTHNQFFNGDEYKDLNSLFLKTGKTFCTKKKKSVRANKEKIDKSIRNALLQYSKTQITEGNKTLASFNLKSILFV